MSMISAGWTPRTWSCALLCMVIAFGSASGASAASITVNGSQAYQVIDGFGVNANHRGWNGTELQPVLDALINQAGMTLFRVVYDNTDWESVNDNTDPTVMNWTYYSTVYNSPEFTRLWDMVSFLNQRGISEGAFLNFMGSGPSWMGGGWLTPGMEEEWAEQIASLLHFGRNVKSLNFRLVAPDNEPDYVNEGISMEDASQYAACLHRLAQRLDANGLSDVRFVAPDLASGGTAYMPEMLADPVIMDKLAHFGLHSYSNGGGGSAGVYDYIHGSAYPDRTFWITEFNVWCSGCDTSSRGTYDWSYCRGTAENLLGHLANGASGGIVWEGYDSYYLHPPGGWSFWGLFSVDDENAATKTYTARKNFYTVAQISRFIRPGARRIGVSGTTYPFWWLLAFYHQGLGQVSIVGVNPTEAPSMLEGTLDSLPELEGLYLYYTSASADMAFAGRVPVNQGAFNAIIPADCVFTLTGSARRNPNPSDFDADGKSDAAVWRPDSGIWYVSPSTAPGNYSATQWGISSDIPASGDYDGDRKADIAVWRPDTGIWYSLPTSVPGTYIGTHWGLPTDKPFPADYDGDSEVDIAVWRPDTGTWYILPSSSPGTYISTHWGLSDDIAVPGDYDSDGKTDIAVWRPSSGIWYILPSSTSGTYFAAQWGMSSDIVVPGDYDGDGKADIAVWRPDSGIWYVLSSSIPGNYTSIQWGVSSDIPASGDYDGDRKTDIAVWRPDTGQWFVLPSATPGTYTVTEWGLPTDIPITSLTRILSEIY